ncbi:MAG: Ig-like domain-containing protein, partial [Gloeobacteraceae cyanobacterium ES-bin-316]|nr:Ig-like domain-containing protein [Ferruginibacter sp.]
MKKNLYSPWRLCAHPRKNYTTFIRNSSLFILFLLVFAGGCKKVDEEAGLTNLCPIVIFTDPANNDTAVSVFANVNATFNKIVDASSINTTSFTLRQGSTLVPGVVTYSGVTATFTPVDPLEYSKVYTATIAKGVTDAANNASVAEYVWSFTTGSLNDNVKPIVIATDPEDDAINVSLNKKISASFSEGMKPLTLNNSTFLIYEGSTAINGVVTYAGNTAVFSPAINLLPNTRYTGTITTGAKDAAGNGIANDYVWTFTTGTTTDVTPPTVISTDPANNATGVVLNKKIAAIFSKAINPSTINNTTFLLKNGANTVIGTVSYAGTTALFSPTVNLLPNT